MRESSPVAVLFARGDSIYKKIPGLDVWDAGRDARKWQGGCPLVAHPPCAQWSKLKALAHKDEWMKSHAPWAVAQIRRWGGVLEHPHGSDLWKFCHLPYPGQFRDDFGGYSLLVDQVHWGHRAQKRTLLYIVGCDLEDLPPMPKERKKPTHVLDTSNRAERKLPYLAKSLRDASPEPFAHWLIEIARNCKQPRIRIK